MVFLLMVLLFAGVIVPAETLTPTYSSSISPGGIEGGLGTIQSGGASVTITPTSISAISDSASTECVGIITWTPSMPVTATLTFDYRIESSGSNFVIWAADWFGQTFEYTNGKVKTFSQSFDITDQIVVSIKAKNGRVSISNISVR